jgi:hypothetical protein
VTAIQTKETAMFKVMTENWRVLGDYGTQKGAKTALTRKWAKKYPTARVIDNETFRRDEPMVETFNMLNGQKCMIQASLRGGCCDPATETYWSM